MFFGLSGLFGRKAPWINVSAGGVPCMGGTDRIAEASLTYAISPDGEKKKLMTVSYSLVDQRGRKIYDLLMWNPDEDKVMQALDEQDASIPDFPVSRRTNNFQLSVRPELEFPI